MSAVLASAAFATTEPERAAASRADAPVVATPTADAVQAENPPEAARPTTAAIEPRAVDGQEAARAPDEPMPEEPSASDEAVETDTSDTATEPTAMTAEPEAIGPTTPADDVTAKEIDEISPEQETAGPEPEATPAASASEDAAPTRDEADAATTAEGAASDDLAAEESTAETETPAEPAEPTAVAVEPAPGETADPSVSETAVEARPDEPADTTIAEPVAAPSQLEPEVLRLIAEADGLGDDERSTLAAFYEGRGDDLLWLNGGAFNPRANAAMAEIRKADDWGLEATAFELPSAPQSEEPAEIAETELKLTRAVLKYASHARGGRIDPRQLSGYIDREPPLLPPSDILAGLVEAKSIDGYLRGLHPQHPQFDKLRRAYLELRDGKLPVEDAEKEVSPKAQAKAERGKKAAADEAKIRKILHNMEQWRWMPEDLGRFHVWANVPEFTLRVMRDGKPVHSERLIVGKRDTQTPIFSDEMETIVFHPFWGVPNSIKVKDLLPGLLRGRNELDRNGLRIQYRGRDIDPASVDWRRTDIRNFHVYQPPGAKNVLGVVKFMFPNKHAVYMHDTPTKHLFKPAQRMFSHGCMRVRDPLKFAEILLSQDKGWDRGRVDWLVKRGSRDNHIKLDTKIPVHITYFTAWIEDDGTLKTAADIYGHEKRIQMGLDGKVHLIARQQENLSAVRAEVVSRLAETQPTWSSPSSSTSQPDWAQRAFGR